MQIETSEVAEWRLQHSLRRHPAQIQAKHLSDHLYRLDLVRKLFTPMGRSEVYSTQPQVYTVLA